MSMLPSEPFLAFRIRQGKHVTSAIERISLDALSTGRIVIRTSHAGLNFKDALATTDRGGVIRHFPRVGGSDVSGHVVHSDDPRWRPGDAVVAYAHGLGVSHDGGFAEYVRLHPEQIMTLPVGVDLLDAAALGVAGATAALAVHLLQEQGLRPDCGDVLINGATGGVGSMAIQMLAATGHRVVAVSSKSDCRDWLLRLGAHDVLSPSDVQAGAGLLASARWGAAVDSLGGEGLDALLRAMRSRGVVASVGNVGGNALNTNVMPFILRGVRLVGVNLTAYRELDELLWSRMVGDLRPPKLRELTQVITLGELPDAITRMLNGHTVGRTVVSMRSN